MVVYLVPGIRHAIRHVGRQDLSVRDDLLDLREVCQHVLCVCAGDQINPIALAIPEWQGIQVTRSNLHGDILKVTVADRPVNLAQVGRRYRLRFGQCMEEDSITYR
ncbi:hypothetical protein D9M71_746350 [compost metagenome]